MHDKMQYEYIVRQKASYAIWSFYRNVALKYNHTYSEYDMSNDIKKAVRNIYQIESTLLRRRPTIKQWEGYYMAHAGRWYYAYTVEGNKVTIHDACHQQNMHNN